MDDLRVMFEYDLWANQRWIPFCGQPELRAIMHHLLAAQARWLQRVTGSMPEEIDDIAEQATLQNRIWQDQVTKADLNEVIRYTTAAGQPFEDTRGLIARHVVNHGTYHRGQMRAVAEALGITNFPETDLILFLRERGAESVI